MNIDSAVVFRYILSLYDHPIVGDWAKMVSKIGRKFAALIAANWPVRQRQNAGEPPPIFFSLVRLASSLTQS